MKKTIVKFRALNLSVNDLKKSIAFYQKLGFEIYGTDSTNYSVSTYMRLSEKSDFMICLTQQLDDRINEELITMELEANEDAGIYHEEAFAHLLDQGIRYENLNASDIGRVICAAGVMKDPDGFIWVLSE